VNATACLLWTGTKEGKGYGYIQLDGYRVAVHRRAFLNAYGYMPPVVRHTCDTPACYSPSHLMPGTQRENVWDAEGRGRAVHPRGVANGRALLTEPDVRAIRASTRKPTALAREYGVSRGAIRHIIERKTWKQVA